MGLGKITFREELSVSEDGGPLDVLKTTSGSLAGRDGSILVTYDEIHAKYPKMNIKEGKALWDANGSGLTVNKARYQKDVEKYRGNIAIELPSPLKSLILLEALDIRPSRRVAEVARRRIKDYKCEVVITESVVDGESVVRLRLVPETGIPAILEYAFLPGKDFALKEYQYVSYEGWPVPNGNQNAKTSIEATRFEKFGGVWVPTQIVESRNMYIGGRPPLQNRAEIQVSKFDSTRPSDEEMSLVFPIGTIVHDQIENSMYEVLDGGGRKQIPFFDPQLGKVVGADTDNPSTQPASGDKK